MLQQAQASSTVVDRDDLGICYMVVRRPSEMWREEIYSRQYPGAFFVYGTSKQSYLDLHHRRLYVKAQEGYYKLWSKTEALFSYLANHLHTEYFRGCNWFFKVDDDTFANKHMLRQMLLCRPDTLYTGFWQPQTNRGPRMAIGAIYGLSRSVVSRWKKWRKALKFQSWDHEDNKISSIMDHHNVTIMFPFKHYYTGRRHILWGDYENPLWKDKRWARMPDLRCFSFAHKVPMEIMDDFASFVEQNCTGKCPLLYNCSSVSVLTSGGTVKH